MGVSATTAWVPEQARVGVLGPLCRGGWVLDARALEAPPVKWGKGTCRPLPNLIHSSTLRKWTVSAARWVWWKHQPSGFLLSLVTFT